MATVINGAPVNFSVSGTGISGTGISGVLYVQTVGNDAAADIEPLKDQSGNLVTEVIYNPSKTATIEFIPSGANIAAAVSNTKLPLIGAFVTITDTLDADIADTHWRVTSATMARSNTSFSKVTLGLVLHAGITAAAS